MIKPIVKDMLFLQQKAQLASKEDVGIGQDLFDDMTAYECFLNNVHIEDFCRKDIVSNAFIFADRLENILKEMKCGYEIILTIQRESCVLTFHSLHESETDWINLCKIDDYKLLVSGKN